jgi:hypothetical protein
VPFSSEITLTDIPVADILGSYAGAVLANYTSGPVASNCCPTLSSLLNSRAALFGDMALRIEKAFGVKMDTLMRMQASFDIAQTRKRAGKIRVKRYSSEARPAW